MEGRKDLSFGETPFDLWQMIRFLTASLGPSTSNSGHLRVNVSGSIAQEFVDIVFEGAFSPLLCQLCLQLFCATNGCSFCPYTAGCPVGCPEWASSDGREIKYLVRVLTG